MNLFLNMDPQDPNLDRRDLLRALSAEIAFGVIIPPGGFFWMLLVTDTWGKRFGGSLSPWARRLYRPMGFPREYSVIANVL